MNKTLSLLILEMLTQRNAKLPPSYPTRVHVTPTRVHVTMGERRLNITHTRLRDNFVLNNDV